jgi:hypothetical protein
VTTRDQTTSTAASFDQKGTPESVREEPEASMEPPLSSAESGTVERASVTGPPADTVEPVETSPPESLFDADKLSGLRSRWTDIQAAFVDDPRQCVQNANALVSDVVDQLTAGFATALSRLEEQWARGEEVSTEDLRVALRRYRGFFERLLEV